MGKCPGLHSQATVDALLWGNGCAHADHHGQGAPRELIRLLAGAVGVELDAVTGLGAIPDNLANASSICARADLISSRR
jgi:hypothetical protein